ATQLNASLDGLQPLLIQVGSIETLLDDSTRLEALAKSAGGKAVLEVWDDMPHVWHMFAPKLPEAVQALESVGAFVESSLTG
ncbi:MAG: alpha/beta hydrolase fold domain-containing protein, partial [Rhodospirillaceae bacterium]|nr:alpha/beta hydrolase fold domain-containing protein [Rhodospirillaceae bacterium]